MLRRLQKLGITATNPDDLTPEQRSAFVRLDLDPAAITWRRVLDVNDRCVSGVTTMIWAWALLWHMLLLT